MQPHLPTEFSDDQIAEAALALGAGKAFRAEVNGYGGTKRMVIAPFYDTQEVMVAVEGGGCAFLNNEARHNRYVFVQYGFQLPHAAAAEQLLNGIADLASQNKALSEMMSDQPVRPQITDQSQPEEGVENHGN